jgi:hypothetical protein
MPSPSKGTGISSYLYGLQGGRVQGCAARARRDRHRAAGGRAGAPALPTRPCRPQAPPDQEPLNTRPARPPFRQELRLQRVRVGVLLHQQGLSLFEYEVEGHGQAVRGAAGQRDREGARRALEAGGEGLEAGAERLVAAGLAAGAAAGELGAEGLLLVGRAR